MNELLGAQGGRVDREVRDQTGDTGAVPPVHARPGNIFWLEVFSYKNVLMFHLRK